MFLILRKKTVIAIALAINPNKAFPLFVNRRWHDSPTSRDNYVHALVNRLYYEVTMTETSFKGKANEIELLSM